MTNISHQSNSEAHASTLISLESLQIFTLLVAVNMIAMIFWLGDSELATQTLSFTPPFDKLVHATAFALMAFFLRFSGLMRGAIWIIILLVGVGVLDELHQMNIPMREASFYDLCADVIGVAAGLWLARLLLFRLQCKNPH